MWYTIITRKECLALSSARRICLQLGFGSGARWLCYHLFIFFFFCWKHFEINFIFRSAFYLEFICSGGGGGMAPVAPLGYVTDGRCMETGASSSENDWQGSNVNFHNFKAILTMQRHRHNVKVSKLLVGLRPYQAYTKRHPCMERIGFEISHIAENVPWPPPLSRYVPACRCPKFVTNRSENKRVISCVTFISITIFHSIFIPNNGSPLNWAPPLLWFVKNRIVCMHVCMYACMY